MSALLIAGPLAIDALPETMGLIGGAGGYAAIAAAPLSSVQLWARGGGDYPVAAREVLGRHHIDLAGIGWDGAMPRVASLTEAPTPGPLLPDIEPTSAEKLGAALVVGLPAAEAERALAVIAPLKPQAVLVAPWVFDARHLERCCTVADALIMPLDRALAATGTADALKAGRRLRELGAKAVVLTVGMLGGVIVYGDKATTYPALPVEAGSSTGTGAAFAGALAGWCAGNGADFRAIKRGCAMASAVAGLCAQGEGPKKLLVAHRDQYMERFNRLRRTAKF